MIYRQTDILDRLDRRYDYDFTSLYTSFLIAVIA